METCSRKCRTESKCEVDKEEKNTSSTDTECLIWDDKLIDMYQTCDVLHLSDTVIDRLGECLIIMLFGGPVKNITKLATMLALNLKNPDDLNPLFPASIKEADNEIVKSSKVWQYSLIDKIEDLEKFLKKKDYGLDEDDPKNGPPRKIEKYKVNQSIENNYEASLMTKESIDLKCTQEKQQKTHNGKGNTQQGEKQATEADNKENVSSSIFCPIKQGHQKLKVTRNIVKYIKEIRQIPSEYRSAFYPFLAAMLGRACTKERKTLKNHIKNAAAKNFKIIYKYLQEMFLELPEPSDAATRALSIGMKPGGPAIISLLKTFLMTRYEEGVLISNGVRGVLDFTLLLPSSYNGMQIIRLAREACRAVRIENLSELLSYLCCGPTLNSINRICQFYEIYHTRRFQTENDAEGSKIEKSKGIMAPWSRLFNDKYWSVLGIKAHSVLGHLFVALVEDNHPEIWNIKSFKNKKLKNNVKLWAVSFHKFTYTAGRRKKERMRKVWDILHGVEQSCPSLDFLY